MEDYLNGINENIWKSIKEANFRQYLVQNVGNVGAVAQMVVQASTRKTCDKKALRELRGALPPVVHNYVHGCKIAKEIQDTFIEKYQRNERTRKSYVEKCLSKLVDFKQKATEILKLITIG